MEISRRDARTLWDMVKNDVENGAAIVDQFDRELPRNHPMTLAFIKELRAKIRAWKALVLAPEVCDCFGDGAVEKCRAEALSAWQKLSDTWREDYSGRVAMEPMSSAEAMSSVLLSSLGTRAVNRLFGERVNYN